MGLATTSGLACLCRDCACARSVRIGGGLGLLRGGGCVDCRYGMDDCRCDDMGSAKPCCWGYGFDACRVIAFGRGGCC